MGTIVVEVMLKSEILDPQGKAIVNALHHLNAKEFVSVRQGKRFVLEVEGDVTSGHLDAARRVAKELLSNPVIEDVIGVHEDTGHQPKQELSASATRIRSQIGEEATDLAKIITASSIGGSN
jgi:phosphoribosylformylglycinamidine synthase